MIVRRLLLTCCVVLSLSACDSDPCGSAGMAEIMAQKFVKQRLRDPDSATFKSVKSVQDAKDACVYRVSGAFSARNGFGGMSGGIFSVTMKKRHGENMWRAEDLVLKE